MSYVKKKGVEDTERFDENFIKGICEICGKPSPRKSTTNTCGQACRKEKTRRFNEEADRIKRQMQQTRKHNRKCLICGKECWPNYFYCIAHHAGKGEPYL